MTHRVELRDVMPTSSVPDRPRAHICVLASLNFPDISPADVALIRRFTRVALTTLHELGASYDIWDTTEPLANAHRAAEFDGLLLLGGGDIDASCYGVHTPHPKAYGRRPPRRPGRARRHRRRRGRPIARFSASAGARNS